MAQIKPKQCIMDENTVDWFGLDPRRYDNSKEIQEYNIYDQVYVIDLSNYSKGQKVPFIAVITDIYHNTLQVYAPFSEKVYEVYGYQIAIRKV